MDKKSKIFFLVFFFLIAGSIGATYYRYVVAHDYMIQAEADCDPYTEICFVYVCDPTAGEECTGDPVEDTSYYKLIDRSAKNIPLCDPTDETCTALVCGEGEADCSYTLCDPTTAEVDTVVCSDPVVYTAENPVEEEMSTDEESSTTGDEVDTTTDEEADINTDATDTIVSTSDTEADSSLEVMPVRNSLVLLNETSCVAGGAFIFVATVKIPVDIEGNYKTRFSSKKAQIISLVNMEGQKCAIAVSLPQFAGKVYVSAKSTAIASVFQSEGIFTDVPEEATTRLAMIEASASFPVLLDYVVAKLPTKNLTMLNTDPTFQDLVQKSAREVKSSLLP